jgi:hypothetical protein
MLFSILFACTSPTEEVAKIEPSFIIVEVEGEQGTISEPLPFSSIPIERTITIQTLDRNADPYPFNGDLKIDIRTGRLAVDMDPWISVENGTWNSTEENEPIRFEAAFGPSRIWVSDAGDKESSSDRVPSYATGVSELLYFHFPTIAEFNNIEDTETNHIVGEFTEVRVEDRDVVVTIVGPNGFWITDLNDGVGNYASMYIYTFQKPTRVFPGYRLTKLNGANQEYLGSTQLSFPSYETEETDFTVDVPELDKDTLCDEQKMEGFESAVVTAKNIKIPSTFTPNSEEYFDYLEYGQWPVDMDGCTFYVDSNALSFAFNPVEHAGETLEITGIVNQIWTKWIIVLYDDNGISYDAEDFPQKPSFRGPVRPQARTRTQ